MNLRYSSTKFLAGLVTFGFVIISGACPVSFAQEELSSEQQVAMVLDELHAAASASEFESYFDLYTTDAVFMGTDGSERWDIDEFKAYAKPRFEAGKGWTYVSTDRSIYVADDSRIAWFDETLENENLGSCRGSGVLVKVGERWKIAQYNLSVPIPNALVRGVVESIRTGAE
jgi:ketosteroid isomerase-like protein